MTNVWPTIEYMYVSSVWDPHTQDQVSQIDIVQRCAARFMTSN